MVDGIEFHGRSIYLPLADVLVLSDLHVGRAQASNVSFPLDERGDLLSRLDTQLERFSPGTVVIAGDLLHSFDRIPDTVRRTVDAIESRVDATDASLVVTPGNHDAMLDAVYDGRRERAYRIAETLIGHGHEEPDESDADDESVGLWILGHEHPAIRIEGRKHPCYLYGEDVYCGADVLVLPAFSRLARGTVVNRQRSTDCLSPLVRSVGLGAFRPIVRDETADETLVFPPLREFRSLL